MSDQIKNMARSVHDRLLNIAKRAGRPYNELQQRFAMERFLYRLSVSPFAEQFTLKGALALLAWTGADQLYRPTMDIDLLGRTANSEANLVSVFQTIAQQQVPDDGLLFDSESVAVEPIAEEAEYHGVRVRLLGRLGNARIPMQIDIGFSDAPVPEPQQVRVPVLLDFPAPSMQSYRPESTIAEKLQAMVDRDIRNSRMKDFADLWFLSQHLDFDGPLLAQAIASTFQHRQTPIPEQPVAFAAGFAQLDSKQTQWKAFLHRGSPEGIPEDFGTVVEGIASFLGPVLSHLAAGRPMPQRWQARGPWRV